MKQGKILAIWFSYRYCRHCVRYCVSIVVLYNRVHMYLSSFLLNTTYNRYRTSGLQ